MSFDGYVDENGKLVPTAQAKPQTAQEWADMVATMAPKQERRWFREGDQVELDGNLFRVKAVKPLEIRLKLIERRKE